MMRGCPNRRIGILLAVTLAAAVRAADAPVTAGAPPSAPTSPPILNAVVNGQTDEVRSLLAAWQDPNAVSDKGYNLLTIAGIKGNSAIIEALLDYGADVDLPSVSGPALLYTAAQVQPAALAALVFGGADLSATSSLKNTALHYAVEKDVPLSIQTLLLSAAPRDALYAKGQTPLMLSTVQGMTECVKALIDGGANPDVKDPQGKTALDLARAGAREEITKVIADRMAAQNRAPMDLSAGRRVKAGEDLGKLVAAATDGQLFVLEPGEYHASLYREKGTIRIAGDRGGKTILTGTDPANPTLGIVDGKLMLQDVTLQAPGEKQLALYAKNSHCFLARCTVTKTAGDGCYLENSWLLLAESKFSAIGRIGVLALAKSSVVAENSRFEAIKQAALQVQDEGNLSVTRCTFKDLEKTGVAGFARSLVSVVDSSFENCGQGAVTNGDGQSLLVTDTQFRNCRRSIEGVAKLVLVRRNTSLDVPADGDGMYFADVGEGAVTDNRIVAAGPGNANGITVRGTMSRPLTLARNTVLGGAGGIFVEAAGPKDRPSVRLTRNRVLNQTKWSVILNNRTRATLAANTILAAEGMGLSVQSESVAVLERNLLAGPQASMNFYQAPAPLTTARSELARGPVLGGLLPHSVGDNDALQSALAQTAAGLELDRAIAATLARVNAPPAELNAAIRQLDEQAARARSATAQITSTTFFVEDAVGRRVECGYSIYDGASPSTGAVTFWAGDIKESEPVLAVLKSDSPLGRLLKASLSLEGQKLFDRWKPGSAPSDDLVAEIAEALNRIVNGPPVEATVKTSLKLDAALAAAAEKASAMAAGDQAKPENREFISGVNRHVLEAAFPQAIARSDVLGHGYPPTPSYLAPGKYWLVYDQDPTLRTLATLELGKKTDAVASVKDGLWLDFTTEPKEPGYPRLYRFRSPKDMQQTLANLRLPAPDRGRSWTRRPGVNEKDVATALALARPLVPTSIFPSQFPPEMKEPERDRARLDYTERQDYIFRIFESVGEPADVDRLLAMGVRPNHEYPELTRKTFQSVATMEARLGTLRQGKLAALTRSADPFVAAMAAIALATHGIHNADDVLRTAVASGEMYTVAANAAWALLADGDPKTIEAMRRLADRCVAKKSELWLAARYDGNPSIAPMLYLLAHGAVGDWKLVTAMRTGLGHVGMLSLLAPDPVGTMAPVITKEANDFAMSLGQCFADRPGREAANFYRKLVNDMGAFYGAKQTDSLYRRQNMQSRMRQVQAVTSWYSPNAVAADIRRNVALHPVETSNLLTELPWWHYPGNAREFVALWLKDHRNYEAQLDYIDHDTLARLVAEIGAGKKPLQYDLYMAAHKVGTGGFQPFDEIYPLGADHRPYVLSDEGLEGHDDFGGGISGVADLVTELSDQTLRIRVRLRQYATYNEIGTLAGIISRDHNLEMWTFQKYMHDGGRPLIAAVNVRHRGRTLDAIDTGRVEDGWMVYEATLDRPDVAETYVDLNMAFFNDRFTLIYPIFGGENGRRMLVRQQMADVAARAGGDAAGRLQAARDLAQAGRVTDALAAYRKALGPRASVDLWHEVADMLTAVRRFDDAAVLLAEATAGNPRDLDLQRQRAQVLFLAGKYDEVTRIVSAAAMTADDTMRYVAAVSLILGGQNEEAIRMLGLISPTFAVPRVLALRYLATYLGNIRKVDPLGAVVAEACKQHAQDASYAALSVLIGTTGIVDATKVASAPADFCRLSSFYGAMHLMRGNTDAARESFQTALRQGQVDTFEHRLAAVLLRKLPPPPAPGK
jgi:tetratricopeptide (TPR) repeat protein